MSWSELLAERRVARHRTSAAELDALRAAVARNLSDAALAGLSADNRYGLAYEAALLSARMAVHAAGYRVAAKTGAHAATIAALALAIGPRAKGPADYFELCRRKRNELSYEAAEVVTEREAEEILSEARKLYDAVEAWLAGRPATG